MDNASTDGLTGFEDMPPLLMEGAGGVSMLTYSCDIRDDFVM